MSASVDVKQLVEVVGDAIVVADPSNVITLWNSGAEKMFGFSAAEALGQPLDIIIPERLRARHNEGYAKTMKTGQTKYGSDLLKVPATHKDGRAMSIAFTVALLHGANGEVTGIVAVIRDETARFQEDRQLRKRVTELEAKLAATAN
ncbi:histidine kinase [Pandoraea faecigallinarum]|uniref:Histidine kinase n=1 Tax=Pandoraea faecigallinarum TaxID=656179 RepID=A0A0H3WVD2_9BURK|nr:PAS domain S-box protein [Pandoraea faecigallinarum]AKM31687.1 histidine kinase [Pandoraea faecigallinarum]